MSMKLRKIKKKLTKKRRACEQNDKFSLLGCVWLNAGLFVFSFVQLAISVFVCHGCYLWKSGWEGGGVGLEKGQQGRQMTILAMWENLRGITAKYNM